MSVINTQKELNTNAARSEFEMLTAVPPPLPVTSWLFPPSFSGNTRLPQGEIVTAGTLNDSVASESQNAVSK